MPVDFDTGQAFKSMRLVWSVEAGGAASAEIDILESQIGTIWTPPHRFVVNGPMDWGGEITNLARSGAPGEITYKASALGHYHRLDKRIVRHDFVVNDAANVHVEALLSEAQDNQFNGDMGFTFGSATGTFPSRERAYCVGANIGDCIKELAAVGRGFDWELDAQGYLNMYGPSRGVDTGFTLADTDTHSWELELDTSELLTNVTALAHPSDPYGPKYRMSRTAMADNYGRREDTIETDVVALNEENPDWEQELYDAGHGLLKEMGGGLINLRTIWLSNNAPWNLGDVWLQDTVELVLPDFFGGNTFARCTDVTVTLDPMPTRPGGLAPIYWVEMGWDALVTDLDVEDGDPDQELS